MSRLDIDDRPAKKRRFFVEDEPEHPPSEGQGSTGQSTNLHEEVSSAPQIEAFDSELLSTFVGETLPRSVVDELQELSCNNVERGEDSISRQLTP